MNVLGLCFLLVSGFAASAQDQWKNVYSENAWEARDRWQKPDELIRHLHIKEGSLVADVGSHEGYMTFRLSRVVGPKGKVYAVDIDQSKLNKLQAHLDKENISNTIAVKGDADNPKLPTNTLDAVIIVDTYHEMKSHDQVLQQIKASLKPGGRLVVCEPIAESRRKLSRAEQEGKHELGMSFAIDDLIKAGFKILTRQDPFADREKIKGDKMWLIVASK